VLEIVNALHDLRSSTSALLLGVEAERWTDADMRVPSLLPGWTRGHVLTHLARNADSYSRTVSGALRGEILQRYPDGPEGRNADIEAGARRGATELLADLRESADRLDRLFTAVGDAGAWDAPSQDERPVHAWVPARWREVEVHRVDLGGSYGAADWPPAFVSYLVPKLAERVGERSDQSLRIEVEAEGSVTTDLPGSVWPVGSGDPVVVRGPDWAVLAWLTGRPEAAAGNLTTAPALGEWM
jgi:maleylpyruvate isomerase